MTRQSGLRGLMLDAARLVESPDYYRRFLDFCADWGINAVIFRLTDELAAWGFGPEDWLHGRFLAAARFTKEGQRYDE